MTSTSSIHFEGSGAGGGHGGMTVSVHYGEVEDCPYKAAGSFTIDVDLPVVSVTWPKKHKQSKKLQIGDDIVRGWLEKLPFLPAAVHVVPRRCRMFFDFSNLASENREEAMQAVYDAFHDKPVVEMGSKGNSVVGSVKRNKAKLTQQSVTIGAEAEVPGLIVVKDWISESEEAEILALLNESEWEKKISRRVQHYGARFSYITRKVATGKLSPDTAEAKQKEAKEEEEDAALEDAVLPQWLQQQADRIAKEVGTHSFDQCTVNEYTPGKGIASHIDTHSAFEDAIASVSLGSGAVMDFSDHRSDRTVSVWMPRRCLLVMTGESRLAWAHRIKFRATDVVDGKRYKRGTRISLTFRKVRSEPCRCKFPEQCDSQLGAMAVTHGGKSGGGYLQWGKELKENGGKEEEADVPPLEGRHVREVYDRIADHFSHTRHTPWPRVEAFLKHLPDNQVVLDVGCGNGKYMGCNPKLHMLGCDTSIELLKIAKERGYQVFSGDVTAIPVRNEASDVTICIAVLHHICSEQRRLQAIHELKRVTKPGGQILIQVSALCCTGLRLCPDPLPIPPCFDGFDCTLPAWLLWGHGRCGLRSKTAACDRGSRLKMSWCRGICSASLCRALLRKLKQRVVSLMSRKAQ